MAAEVTAAVVKEEFVLGHIGLTPQTVTQLGGFKVQGKTEEAARQLIGMPGLWKRRGPSALYWSVSPWGWLRKSQRLCLFPQ